jgi:hypothetical protein
MGLTIPKTTNMHINLVHDFLENPIMKKQFFDFQINFHGQKSLKKIE